MKKSDFSEDILQRASKIRLLVLDVDGVLSDGKLTFSNSGEELKAFSTLDGQGIKMLQRSGIEVAVITGRSSQIVSKRMQDLGVTKLLQGREDKLTALHELLETEAVDFTAIAYMGDDLPDLAVIRRAGLGMSPANGHWRIQQDAHWSSLRAGGEGAVREACDLILLAQDKLEQQLAPYL